MPWRSPTMKLTPEQVESFHRDGCLVVNGYLDDHGG